MKQLLWISTLSILTLIWSGNVGSAQHTASSPSEASSEQIDKLQSIYVSDALPDFFKNLDTLNEVEPIFRLLNENEVPNEADAFVFFLPTEAEISGLGNGFKDWYWLEEASPKTLSKYLYVTLEGGRKISVLYVILDRGKKISEAQLSCQMAYTLYMSVNRRFTQDEQKTILQSCTSSD